MDIFGKISKYFKSKDTTNQNYTVSSKVKKIKQQLLNHLEKRLLESSCLSSTTQHLEKSSIFKQITQKTTADPLSLSVNEADINPKQKKRSSCGTTSKIVKLKLSWKNNGLII